MFNKSQALAMAVGILVMGSGTSFSDTFDPTGYMTLSRIGAIFSQDPTGYANLASTHGNFGMSYAIMLSTAEIKGYDVKIDPTGYLTLASRDGDLVN